MSAQHYRLPFRPRIVSRGDPMTVRASGEPCTNRGTIETRDGVRRIVTQAGVERSYALQDLEPVA